MRRESIISGIPNCAAMVLTDEELQERERKDSPLNGKKRIYGSF